MFFLFSKKVIEYFNKEGSGCGSGSGEWLWKCWSGFDK